MSENNDTGTKETDLNSKPLSDQAPKQGPEIILAPSANAQKDELRSFLLSVPGIGPSLADKIMASGSLDMASLPGASKEQLLKVPGISDSLAIKILQRTSGMKAKGGSVTDAHENESNKEIVNETKDPSSEKGATQPILFKIKEEPKGSQDGGKVSGDKAEIGGITVESVESKPEEKPKTEDGSQTPGCPDKPGKWKNR
jgi:hypothetical protein